MKLETVKSVILAVLIGISLLLTLGLWSYQPNYKFMANMEYAEADIGGVDDVHKKDVIVPTSVIFHRYNRVYGFADPKQRESLYRDMQSWVMYNFKTGKADGPPTDDYQVELTFPYKLPMKILDSLFSFNEKIDLPDWSFQRIYITFNEDLSLKVQFLSENGDQRATALVNNSKKYNELWNYVTNPKELSEYILFKESDTPIYIPKNKPEMKQRRVAMQSINPGELVDVLFSNPEIVRRDTTNAGGVYYTDEVRGMRVKGDGKSIEFFNTLNTSYNQMEPMNLLDTSINNINEQKGWTSEFHLEELRPATNFIRYRMFYSGYPVFNSDLAVIEQEFRNDDLYKYQRPIVSFNTSPGENTVELPSGEDVIYMIDKSDMKADEIDDIRIGYHLAAEDDDLPYLTMKPAWYVKYNGNWQELEFDKLSINKGGA